MSRGPIPDPGRNRDEGKSRPESGNDTSSPKKKPSFREILEEIRSRLRNHFRQHESMEDDGCHNEPRTNPLDPDEVRKVRRYIVEEIKRGEWRKKA